jgi:predicted metalloprotease with PDZ domain
MPKTQDLKQNLKIEYSLAMPKPATHLFEVEIKFEGLRASDSSLELIMPVWRSGRYLVFDFSSGVQQFEAFDVNGNKLAWCKTDKSTWKAETKSLPAIIIKYKVFANEFNQRTRGLNTEHAFVNSTSVFMYAPKYRSTPVTLKIIPYKNWHVTTGLKNLNDDPFVFRAPNYDYFIDCPLEIGFQTDFEFEVDSRKHIFSIFGEVDYDKDKIVNDITKIIKKNYEFWGKVPYEKYVFIVHCTPKSGGGTEHINSTVLGIRRAEFETEAGYSSFLRLVSHEFFHTWNVKQLKPKGLTPFDYTKENYTSELWIAEGGTSYYDGLNVLRTGQYSFEEFYKEITLAVEDDKKRPGNRIQSISESSFDAWVKFWKPTQNKYNSETDYYTKGSYVCMILDLEIRNSSANKHSLDDVFRKMYNDFPLDVKGYTNDDFMAYSEQAAGINLTQFFNDYVYETAPIDWNKYLSYAGLELKSKDDAIVPALGIRTIQREGKIIINDVFSGSSAEDAEISFGDEITALEGEMMPYEEMEKRIKQLHEGDKIVLTIIRSEKLIEVKLTLKGTKINSYYLEKVLNSTLLQKNIYEAWLGVKW